MFHPLPHRNTSFMFVGYWVVDEIMRCNKEGIDWLAEPDKTKYQSEIETIIAAIRLYGDSLCLESRNGRIKIATLLQGA